MFDLFRVLSPKLSFTPSALSDLTSIRAKLGGHFLSDRLEKAQAAAAKPTDPYADLVDIPGFSFRVVASAGLETRAHELAARTMRGYAHFASALGAKARGLTLVVLSKADWPKYAQNPAFGMPHHVGGQLFVAGEDSDLWDPVVAQLPIAVQELFGKIYGIKNGKPDMSKFFDLLVVHELAHAFIDKKAIKMPRTWLTELFCNLALHSYVVGREPQVLAMLETAPSILARAPAGMFKYKTLSEFESAKDMAPPNYGWYQFNFHVGAKNIYDNGGPETLRYFWDTFKKARKLSDAELEVLLAKEIDPQAARILSDWPGGR